MQIKADEISAIIKEKIKGFDKQVDVKETGSVIQVGDGIAKVYGLDGAMADFVRVPSRCLHRVPHNLRMEDAAMT